MYPVPTTIRHHSSQQLVALSSQPRASRHNHFQQVIKKSSRASVATSCLQMRRIDFLQSYMCKMWATMVAKRMDFSFLLQDPIILNPWISITHFPFPLSSLCIRLDGGWTVVLDPSASLFCEEAVHGWVPNFLVT